MSQIKLLHVALRWLRRRTQFAALCSLLILAGCDQSGANEYSGGNLGAINHVAGQSINWFSVDGYRVPGTGGGYCCVMIPDKWRPGLVVHIEWEIDPNPHEKIPMRKEGAGYDQNAYALHKAKYRQYSADVPIPEYDESAGITVHFLPCQQVKVYAGIASYGADTYPIKEPTDMKEPATCPK
ncbi:DUF3304 domain-containing protein [Pantoea sp. X85]|jgi:hypothetical protein|uniref:DUF3304 domain-containing protein n=1 Tax=Pantoea sp. X85 TaxID=3037258 RepID=UPI002413134D|nr:DUF3304 domain-containing protein [Pantoea sp. X85]WFL68513.1 DUF3304 domain-containing protein [Pantoea sp. X85]